MFQQREQLKSTVNVLKGEGEREMDRQRKVRRIIEPDILDFTCYIQSLLHFPHSFLKVFKNASFTNLCSTVTMKGTTQNKTRAIIKVVRKTMKSSW